MKKQLPIHIEEANFKYVEILKSNFTVSFEYFIAWPSVLVFVNQNIVTVTSGVLKNGSFQMKQQ